MKNHCFPKLVALSSCTTKSDEDGVGFSLTYRCQMWKNIYGWKDSEAETKSKLEEIEALQFSRLDMLIFVFDEMINLMFIIDLYSFVCNRILLPLPYSSMMGKPQRSLAAKTKRLWNQMTLDHNCLAAKKTRACRIKCYWINMKLKLNHLLLSQWWLEIDIRLRTILFFFCF
jgi:hypothetical protein